jgi:hypothetical protein
MNVQAQNLKDGDFVEIKLGKLEGFRNPINMKGLIRKIQEYTYGANKYKYLEILTEKGIQGVYLQMLEEVTKTIVTEDKKYELVDSYRIQNLKRVVDRQGSDPEIFAVDKDNNVIPAFNFLGSKKNPSGVHATTGIPVYWDGFQAEFNIPGTGCLESTMTYLTRGLIELNKLVKKHNKEARLTIQPTFEIAPHLIREGKEEHVQFGCMPSKNAYDMEGIKLDGRDTNIRSAGGHIHLQLNEAQKKRIPEYVKALDAILGVASVSMFGKYDDPRRRQFYGLAGEYRTPAHGLEYRVLSNAWLGHPTAAYMVFELARKIISMVDEGLFKYWKYNEQDVISCINNCNIPLACAIMKDNEDVFKDLIASFAYQDKKNVDVIYATFMTGIENLVGELDNVEANWGLNGGDGKHFSYQIEKLYGNPRTKELLKIKF